MAQPPLKKKKKKGNGAVSAAIYSDLAASGLWLMANTNFTKVGEVTTTFLYCVCLYLLIPLVLTYQLESQPRRSNSCSSVQSREFSRYCSFFIRRLLQEVSLHALACGQPSFPHGKILDFNSHQPDPPEGTGEP